MRGDGSGERATAEGGDPRAPGAGLSASGPRAADPRRWWALAVLCAASFMVILDGSIVNVALPSIQEGLGFSPANLQWLVSGYALAFGGFLLLGGRASDLFGRRRLFVAGVALFSAASLLCGLAQSEGTLIAARVAQGLGGAILSPAALSLVATTFPEGEERNRALGIYGALAALGFASGVLLGGVLTDALGWRWVFLVNVPVGAAAVALAPRLLRESRAASRVRGLDLAGAVLSTAALGALVYGVSVAEGTGFSPATVLFLALSAALLAAFVAAERRSPAPLVRLGIFRDRTLAGANLLGLLVPGSFAAVLFVLTLYMQQVLGYSAVATGLAFLPMALAVLVSSSVFSRFVGRFGVKPVMASGTAVMALGLLPLARVSAGSAYATGLLPGMLVVAVGFGAVVGAMMIAATAGVGDEEQGLASGLINTATQVGAAVLVAVLAAVAAGRTGPGANGAEALVAGYGASLAVGAGFVGLATLVALFVVRDGSCEPDDR